MKIKFLCLLLFFISACDISASHFNITLSVGSTGEVEYIFQDRKYSYAKLKALLEEMNRSDSYKNLTVFIYTGSKTNEINTKRLFTVLELLKNAGWEGTAIIPLVQEDGDKLKYMDVPISLKDIKIDIRDPIISRPADFFSSQPATADDGADFITKMPTGFEIVKVSASDTGGYPQEIRHLATGIEMIYVASGEFMMGSPPSENDRRNNETQHKVKLTNGYYIGKYEVTQEQWEKLMGSNPSKFKGANLPVEQVSWDDCKLFCNKLGRWFRLPTEAEWEFAARGGNKSKGYIYSGSNNLDEVGWYDLNSGGKTHEVGQKTPNELGIYDMSGNVREWCFDYYRNYPLELVTDPSGPSSAPGRVVRAGGGGIARVCRAAARSTGGPTRCDETIGFRLMLEIPLPGEGVHRVQQPKNEDKK